MPVDGSFSGSPEDVTTVLLQPKVSAIAHRAPTGEWNPEAAPAFQKNGDYADLTAVEIGVDDHGTTVPFLLSFTTPAWRIAYRADFGDTGLTYARSSRIRATADQAAVTRLNTYRRRRLGGISNEYHHAA